VTTTQNTIVREDRANFEGVELVPLFTIAYSLVARQLGEFFSGMSLAFGIREVRRRQAESAQREKHFILPVVDKVFSMQSVKKGEKYP
jgi:hypothetical protein